MSNKQLEMMAREHDMTAVDAEFAKEGESVEDAKKRLQPKEEK